MRHDSADNLEATIRQTLGIKSNLEKKSVRERYHIINRIRERYLVPLRDVIDIKKPVQNSLDFLAHGSLSEEFSRTKARLLRLRKRIRSDFEEAGKDVEPLYKSLKKENRIAKGASIALQMIDRQGLDRLNLNSKFSITFMRVEGMVSDDLLEGYLHKLANYTPAAPDIIDDPVFDGVPVDFIDPDILRKKITQSLSITDSLGWLIENYPDGSLNSILQAYIQILKNDFGKTCFSDEPDTYTFGHYKIKAFPVSIEKGQ